MWLRLGFGLGPGFGTKLALQFKVCLHLSDEGGVWMEPCAPGIAQYNLCGSIPAECVDTSHCFHLHLNMQFPMVVGT